MEHHPLAQVKRFFFDLVPGLNDEKWIMFEELAVVKRYKKGAFLIKPGQVCNYISFVNYGLIRSFFLVDGKEVVYHFSREECYYSDYESFLSRQPSQLYGEALEDTETVDISYEGLQMLYAGYPECERAGRLVAESLFVILSERNTSFLLQTPEQRYKKFMENFAGIVNRVPQYMIASYLGITPEALSRIRARMSRRQVEIDLDQ